MTPPRPIRTLDTSHGPLRFGARSLLMGILNVTPDSFSDAGRYLDPDAAIAHALNMAAQDADLLDIGGESTRPGSDPVPPDEQTRRVIPVIRNLRAAGLKLPISIDTRSALVAAAALDAGADILNDVSALRDDPDMPRLVAQRRIPFIVMHMQGTPKTMQQFPTYTDVVAEVLAFFQEREQALAAAGVDASRMIVDPGLGFGKTTEHNLALLREIRQFTARWPVLVGPSRKRFIREILNEPDPAKTLLGTAAVVAHCALSGVNILRVHDVAEMSHVIRCCDRLRRNPFEESSQSEAS